MWRTSGNMILGTACVQVIYKFDTWISEYLLYYQIFSSLKQDIISEMKHLDWICLFMRVISK